MSAKIKAVAIQKGGTGKTTTALTITAGLTLKGYKVLAVDLDAQGNFSGTIGAKRDGAGKEHRLPEALESVTDAYDYIIIDAPPALGILTINALTACHSVIIPAQADLYSLESIEELAETIKAVRKHANPTLSIEGIVLTRYSSRSVLSKDVLELAKRLAAKLDTKVFNATIRESITVKEAQINRQSLYSYAPKAKVTEDYTNLINELLGEE